MRRNKGITPNAGKGYYEKGFNTKTFPSVSEKCRLEQRLETEVKRGTS